MYETKQQQQQQQQQEGECFCQQQHIITPQEPTPTRERRQQHDASAAFLVDGDSIQRIPFGTQLRGVSGRETSKMESPIPMRDKVRERQE